MADAGLVDLSSGRRVTVSGLTLVRQRPGSAKGVIFMTIEDETGIANIIVWPKTFERYRSAVLGGRLVRVRGRLQSESGVIHVVAEEVEDITAWLGSLSEQAPAIESLAHADEIKRPVVELREKLVARSRLAQLIREVPTLRHDYRTLSAGAAAAMPRGRNFH
jgi:error-prone DNA polymerase